ncbi:FkbM family methyltransferase [Hymenobacter rubidus]|uniref:FkbM family methyltransferase n=1 Tax=Hymenobacter rubidus TaxID=1441626 RepID=UPI00191C98EC|nr:FkbM family methyltransferase [Hymenobacter rubidus]
MFRYLINSFKRKLARRVTQKHPTRVDHFELAGLGQVDFTNWENPLVEKKEMAAETVAFFKQFLHDGDGAIDIGANIGHMTVQMALATGKTGLTLGFDPNPYVYDILAENALLNPNKTAIKAHNLAISDEDNEFFYNSSEASFNNGGISLTSDNRHGKFALSHKVKGVNLEAFLEREYPGFIDKLKLIKIDTEGYDKEIIKSISDLLFKHHPVVITECFGKNSPEEKFEQFQVLKGLGYSLFYISDFTIDAEVVPILKQEDMLNWKHFDFYCTADQSQAARR